MHVCAYTIKAVKPWCNGSLVGKVSRDPSLGLWTSSSNKKTWMKYQPILWSVTMRLQCPGVKHNDRKCSYNVLVVVCTSCRFSLGTYIINKHIMRTTALSPTCQLLKKSHYNMQCFRLPLFFFNSNTIYCESSQKSTTPLLLYNYRLFSPSQPPCSSSIWTL